MDDIIIRDATISDIPFLVETIIEAEKGSSDKLSYCTVFGLSEEDARKYIADMLSEEIDGCEISVSSFIVGEHRGKVMAAICLWAEGGEDEVSSAVLKGNLLNYVLPKHCIERAKSISPVIGDLHIECAHNSIQLSSGYVLNEYRGSNIAGSLIFKKVGDLLKERPWITEMYVQIFDCNRSSIRNCEKLGFTQIMVRESSNDEILKYLPSNKKILMKKDLLIK